MTDNDIKKMALLLKQGATMLDKSCPNCGKILFKLANNQIICPICEREVKIIKDNNKTEDNPNHKQTKTDMSFYEINNRISRSLERLLDKLEKNDDLEQISRILAVIDTSLGILKKLKEIQETKQIP